MMILSTLQEIYKPILVKEIIGPIITITISFIAYSIIKNMIKSFFKLKINKLDQRKSKTLRSLITNVMKYLIIFIDIMIILEIFGISTTGFFASLGVIGVVVGLALQDILKDLLSGISIILENQYAVGDVVTIDGFKGEIIFLGLRITKLKGPNGEIKIVSNRNVIDVINHSLEKDIVFVDFDIAYEENNDKVEEILQELCEQLKDKIPQITGKVELVGITNLGESGVKYRITAETKANNHYIVQRLINKEVKTTLDKNKITIPYNQLVIHNV